MQLRLDGRSPIDVSIDLLREFEPPEGYYLAFSGGKDSVALLGLARMAGVRFDAHYSMTTIDPPELTRFIRREFPTVEWHVPEVPFWQNVRTKGLPTRTARWCCKEYKEIGGAGRVVLTGIRADESRYRAKRGVFQTCATQRRWFVNPLFHWSETDVWDFIRSEGLPYCSLYDEGFTRLGCVVCPFNAHVAESMARWPVFWRLTREGLDEYFARSQAAQSRWPDADAMWAWWLDRYAPYPLPEGDRPPTLPFEDERERLAAEEREGRT